MPPLNGEKAGGPGCTQGLEAREMPHEDRRAVGGWKETPAGPQQQERAPGSCRAPDLQDLGRFVQTVPPGAPGGSLCLSLTSVYRCWGDLVHFVSPCPFPLPSPGPLTGSACFFSLVDMQRHLPARGDLPGPLHSGLDRTGSGAEGKARAHPLRASSRGVFAFQAARDLQRCFWGSFWSRADTSRRLAAVLSAEPCLL